MSTEAPVSAPNAALAFGEREKEVGCAVHRACVYFLLKDPFHTIPDLKVVKPMLGLTLAPNGLGLLTHKLRTFSLPNHNL